MGGIKCSYEDCHRRFDSQEKMKRHKEKDPDHFYCKRCDVDCEDDTDFLIHQITSSKHMACPKCGQEFRGASARDVHVRDRHREKQPLKCVGCSEMLNGAAAYMSHIAKNECRVITLEAFDRLRAERELKQEAFDEALATNNVQYREFSHISSDTDTNGGTRLLDEDLPPLPSSGGFNTNSVAAPLQPAKASSQQSANPLVDSMASLSVDRYPPLPLQQRTSSQATTNKAKSPNDNLIEFDDTDTQQRPSAWAKPGASSNCLFPAKVEKLYPSQSDLSGMPSDNMRTNITGATYGDDSVLRRPGAGVVVVGSGTAIPAAGPAPENDPNAPFRGVQTIERITTTSILDPMNYYNDIQCKFICPGKSCAQRAFDTAEGFKAHLLTGAHVGGKTQCPGCLRKFRDTPALIAHCESASRKCRISRSQNYNQVLRDLTAGLLGTQGHTENEEEVRYVANPVDEWNDDMPSAEDRGQW